MVFKIFEEKENLSIPGTNLLTRPLARQFIPWLSSSLAKCAASFEFAEFSFERVDTADTSFLDELLIVNGLEAMKHRKIGRTPISLSHLSASTFDNARSVFGNKKIPVVCWKGREDFELLGHLENKLARTLRHVMTHRECTAVELARKEGIAINTASTRLSKLYKLSIVSRREEISEKGREYIYYAG